jgi:antitoxin component of MazEF toxin-antitoxin module
MRRLFRAGKSIAVLMPLDWARGLGLDAGSEVEVWYDGYQVVVRPKSDEKVALPEGLTA